ncbi:MAG: amidase, partial [Solirubrobacteraceae bacterium]
MSDSAVAIARAVRAREVSAVEVLDAHVARIEEHDGRLNALVLPRLEQARAEAQAADRGEPRGPLHGVPFTAKDPLPVAGMRSPCGSRLLADHVNDADCEPVRRLRAAGAILVGKTNVSEFCMHWDSTNVLFGSTHNPHDVSRTPGGSSGGEAAALASGMTALGLGSDLGGSIRNPAHFTGLFGLRPGRGTVPLAAHHPLPLSAGMRLAMSVGPLARSAADLELALTVLAPAARSADPPGRVAVFEEDGLQPVSRTCREAVRRAAAALEDAGHAIVDERPPGQAEARAAFDAIFNDELAVALPAFVAGREAALSPYAAEAMEAMRGHEPSFERYVDAFHRIAVLEHAAAEWMARHPVALCPVAPDVAPPVGEGSWPPIDGEPARPGGKLSLCTYANALGLPAVAVPVMRSPEGLPVGVQLIGRRGSERTLLALAGELEAALGGWLAPGAG